MGKPEVGWERRPHADRGFRVADNQPTDCESLEVVTVVEHFSLTTTPGNC